MNCPLQALRKINFTITELAWKHICSRLQWQSVPLINGSREA